MASLTTLSSNFSNITTNATTKVNAYYTTGRYLVLILFPIIIFISITGNTLIIWLTAKFKCVKGSVNKYIINKAICSIIISVVPTVAYFVQILLENWPFGSVACDVTVVIEYAVLTTANMMLILKCLEQYFAVVKPFMKMNRKFAKIMIVVSWLIGWPIALPFVLFQPRHVKHDTFNECLDLWVFLPDQSSRLYFGYFVIIFVLLFIAPLLIMTFLYARVIYEFLYKMKRPGERSNSMKQRARKKKWNTIKLLITSVIAFYVCWLPSFVQELVFFTSYDKLSQHLVLLIGLISSTVAYFYCALNPFVYFYFIEQYRKSFHDEVVKGIQQRFRKASKPRERSYDVNNGNLRLNDKAEKQNVETPL